MQNELLDPRCFQFVSSYRGVFDFGVKLPSGAHHRLSVRTFRDDYDEKWSTQTAEEFERAVNGHLGYVRCLTPEVLTNEMVAAFNRARYLEHERSVSTMLSNPEKYGGFEPTIFNVFVGGQFDIEKKVWVELNDFETIRTMAGIPDGECVDARHRAREQLKLVA